jgi:hypothetical protein
MSLEAVKAEIELLAKAGLVNPHTVLERARDENSALHGHFTWDDGEAAEKWRVEEARRLIRVFVITPQQEAAEPIRAFVSLTSDRRNGGGYRNVEAVLSDEELKEQFLSDALAELKSFQSKYSRIKELAQVFKAIEKVSRSRRPAQEQRRAAA